MPEHPETASDKISTASLASLTSPHGNPTIILPTGHDGGRLDVIADGAQSAIWVSHQFSRDDQAVRVDVWHGRYAGDAARSAVLPPGRYSLVHRSAAGTLHRFAKLDVTSRTLFDSHFRDGHEPTDALSAGWECRADLVGAGVSKWQTAAFRHAAMHGAFSATFKAPQHTTSTFGLISRYYNHFNHLRLVCDTEEGFCTLRLCRIANAPPDQVSARCIAQQTFRHATAELHIEWVMNGNTHTVRVNGDETIRVDDDYMGGVDVVGWFAAGSAVCTQAAMETYQPVPRHTIETKSYTASIRAGNIDRLFLKASKAPNQSLCWESGIQFGHIGGSEVKFTQGARLQVVENGSVATTVAWQGPMPRLAEGDDDVRGYARGFATFFRNHIVIADDVLALTSRSVGPDIDLLGRLLAGSARIALGDATAFTDWNLPADGSMQFIRPDSSGPTFPTAVAFPLLLGGERWWLRVLVLLRCPSESRVDGTSVFAWQCPSGLTASHDFRCSPTISGQEYRYTIDVSWERGDDVRTIEQNLLRRRRNWVKPMIVSATLGQAIRYTDSKDQPAEATDFDGCFDRRSGQYVVVADGEHLRLNMDPRQSRFENPSFVIRNWHAAGPFDCALNGRQLAHDRDFVFQRCTNGELWIELNTTIDCPTRFEVLAHDPQS